VIQSFGKLEKGTVTSAVVNRPGNQSNWFVSLVGSLGVSTFPERKQKLLRLLATFKKETFADIGKAHWRRILKAFNTVSRWLCEDPREMQELHIYRMLVRAAQQLSGRIRDPATRQSYVRYGISSLDTHRLN
jgi:hypothetical protein